MILVSQDGPKMRYMHVLRFERYIKSKAVDTEKEKQEKKKKGKEMMPGIHFSFREFWG